jgi:spoIIIJ-associated protein
MEKTKELIDEILKRLEVKADVEVEIQDGGEDEESGEPRKYLWVKIKGDNLGELIGHHGQTLEAIQTILGLISSKESKEGEERYRVVVDINDYREKREEYLKSLALRALDQVRESGQDMELEPMKPYERRVVHMTLQSESDVTTESLGEGETRRVVIKKV